MNPQNPGQFMNPQGNGAPGQGSALLRLMQLRNQGATPQAGNNVPLPAAPVETGSPVNMTSMRDAGQQPQQPIQPQAQPGAQPMNPQASIPAGDPNLGIALQALANYTQSHGKALEAQHDVPRKTAEAKMISASAQPVASPVS